MKSAMIAKVEKRIIAVMLSLVMVVGVFAGVKLDTKAAGTEEIRFEDLKKGDVVHTGDIITFSPNAKEEKYQLILECDIPGVKGATYLLGEEKNSDGSVLSVTVSFVKHEEKRYTAFRMLGKVVVSGYAYASFEFIEENESETENLDSDQSHTCNFQWVTTIDPQAGMDGLEEYKCVYCGAVQESYSIPASVAAVKDFYGKVKDAPANGTVTYDSGKLYTISDYLLKKMAERNDVAVTVNFEYQNAKYELTFPAGTDFTPVLTDEETMYGYFGVAAKLGLTVVAK